MTGVGGGGSVQTHRSVKDLYCSVRFLGGGDTEFTKSPQLVAQIQQLNTSTHKLNSNDSIIQYQENMLQLILLL